MTETKEKTMKEVPDLVQRYLAEQGRWRDGVRWDGDAFRYPVQAHLNAPDTQDDVDACAHMLPLVVPGLQVLRSKLQEGRGYVWFAWGRQAMWKRYEALWEGYGVADERLVYYPACQGTVGDDQGILPSIVKPTPYATGDSGFFASYTLYALRLMDGAFAHRIQYPNCGGPFARDEDRRCQVGNAWWLVGSRGDSIEVLSLEIEASPLAQDTKQNLLENLVEFRKDMGYHDSDRVPCYESLHDAHT